jgi:hypothetical protein
MLLRFLHCVIGCIDEAFGILPVTGLRADPKTDTDIQLLLLMRYDAVNDRRIVLALNLPVAIQECRRWTKELAPPMPAVLVRQPHRVSGFK